MEIDCEIKKDFICALAKVVHSESFLSSALRLMDSDEKRKLIIEYLQENPAANKKDIEEKMFYLSIRKNPP